MTPDNASAPLPVALVGFGLAGRVFHAPLVQATPGLRLACVVSSDPTKVHQALGEMDVAPTLADALQRHAIALVVIASPNQTHVPLARQALAAGCHVVIDKPMAPTLAQARALANEAAQRGRILSVFHNRRWDADFLALRAAVESGQLGQIAELHSHFDRFRPQVQVRWREQPGPASGLWFDLGPHLVDQALQLFGLPESVSADIFVQREDAQVDDAFHVILRYRRLRVHLHAGSLVRSVGPRFIVHGSGGSWIKHGLDAQEAQLREGLRPGDAGWALDPAPARYQSAEAEDPTEVPLPAGRWTDYYAGIASAVRDGTTVPVTADSAIDAMRVLEAAQLSAANGCAIAL
jgi:predicted dehydrogenase